MSRARADSLSGALLVLPAIGFLLVFFLAPNLLLVGYSVIARMEAGVMQYGLTFDNYVRAFSVDLYWLVLVRTVRMGLMAALVSAAIAYPLAIAIAQGGLFGRVVTLVVVTPLLVNVVIRSYAWSQLLSRQGALNWALTNLGIAENPPQLLYTEWAVLIASVHVFLPFIVLPLAAAIGAIAPEIGQAARMAGANRVRVFLRVILPLSVPGLAVGLSLVFSLTAAAYVTPQILGGNFSPLIGTLIHQQVLALNDWPFGAALASLLIVLVLSINLVFLRGAERLTRRWTAGAGN
ncbi:ABC transporter permease [Arsenicitalea aurantiaca]|nr:ABC transporter permease [Arsenicitalea aurantiaca]